MIKSSIVWLKPRSRLILIPIITLILLVFNGCNFYELGKLTQIKYDFESKANDAELRIKRQDIFGKLNEKEIKEQEAIQLINQKFATEEELKIKDQKYILGIRSTLGFILLIALTIKQLKLTNKNL
jgi:hypothetical protein